MNVIIELLKAMLGLAAILGVWLLVQRAFCATLPGAAADGDALAGRLGCHGCTCETSCENRPPAPGDAPETP